MNKISDKNSFKLNLKACFKANLNFHLKFHFKTHKSLIYLLIKINDLENRCFFRITLLANLLGIIKYSIISLAIA